MDSYQQLNPYQPPATPGLADSPVARLRTRSWLEIGVLSVVGAIAVAMALFIVVMCVIITFVEKESVLVAPIMLAIAAMLAAAGIFLLRGAWSWSRVYRDRADP
jgi:hypothetical protein